MSGEGEVLLELRVKNVNAGEGYVEFSVPFGPKILPKILNNFDDGDYIGIEETLSFFKSPFVVMLMNDEISLIDFKTQKKAVALILDYAKSNGAKGTIICTKEGRIYIKVYFDNFDELNFFAMALHSIINCQLAIKTQV